MKREKITVVVPVRKGSQRVKNKNFRPFADKNLLIIKLETLVKLNIIDDVVVSTDSDHAMDIAKQFNVSVHERDPYYASSECNNSDFFKNLAENIDGDYIIYSPCTAPLIKLDTYYDFINRFINSKEEYDSMLTVSYLKHHMWLNNNPLNYDPHNSPNTQDLPDIKKLTYGINIIGKENMIKYKNVVGSNPMFYALDDIESIDVDTPLEFEIAEFLYKKHRGNF